MGEGMKIGCLRAKCSIPFLINEVFNVTTPAISIAPQKADKSTKPNTHVMSYFEQDKDRAGGREGDLTYTSLRLPARNVSLQ